ncbi:hypothetical protein HDU84_005863 [Entophlyctis sp. JEL0112]|nr:hypothetical protein HDU84_005863 [Entophlyctis sp. JEL0112]
MDSLVLLPAPATKQEAPVGAASASGTSTATATNTLTHTPSLTPRLGVAALGAAARAPTLPPPNATGRIVGADPAPVPSRLLESPLLLLASNPQLQLQQQQQQQQHHQQQRLANQQQEQLQPLQEQQSQLPNYVAISVPPFPSDASSITSNELKEKNHNERKYPQMALTPASAGMESLAGLLIAADGRLKPVYERDRVFEELEVRMRHLKAKSTAIVRNVRMLQRAAVAAKSSSNSINNNNSSNTSGGDANGVVSGSGGSSVSIMLGGVRKKATGGGLLSTALGGGAGGGAGAEARDRLREELARLVRESRALRHAGLFGRADSHSGSDADADADADFSADGAGSPPRAQSDVEGETAMAVAADAETDVHAHARAAVAADANADASAPVVEGSSGGGDAFVSESAAVADA